MVTIVLAGGASARFGSPKAEAMLGGHTLLDRARRAFPGAIVQITEPMQGGPVSAIAAALAGIDDEVVNLVAVDVPFADRVIPLLNLGDSDAAVPLDDDQKPQWLCARYRTSALRRAIGELDDPVGASMRGLVGTLDVAYVSLGADAKYLLDIDTPADLVLAQQLLNESVAGPLDHR